MPANFQLVLDTTGPQNVAAEINGGAAYATSRAATVQITTSDPDTTGYQAKIWGDVDLAADPNVQDTEANSTWITLTPSIAITLAAGDGVKTVNVRLRDDVWNQSGAVVATTTMDTTAPVVTILTGPNPAKISKVAGKDVSTVTWHSDSDFEAYQVRVVPADSSDHTAGTLIGVANGSDGTSGGAGAANTTMTTDIHGADLEAASAGDGSKIVKVFVQDNAGNWSV